MTGHFETVDGVMVPAVTSVQMSEIDRIAVEETGPHLVQMMENAGRSLAISALRTPRLLEAGGPIVVMAGTGGNGGGGICAARHLANRGLEVRLVVTDDSRLGEIPALQLDIFRSTPGRLIGESDLDRDVPALIVDALVGYSLKGDLRGISRDLAVWANNADAPIISLDVPSGVEATTGEAPAAHIQASQTVTLALPKTGLDGEAVGDLYLADLGIPAEAYRRAGISVPTDVFAGSFMVSVRPRSVD